MRLWASFQISGAGFQHAVDSHEAVPKLLPEVTEQYKQSGDVKPEAHAQWQSPLAAHRKLSGDGTQKPCKNRTACAVPLQLENQNDRHWARVLPLRPKTGGRFGTPPQAD